MEINKDSIFKKGVDETEKKIMKMEKKMRETLTVVENTFGDVDFILPAEVTPFGNSGHIPMPKKYVGRKGKVLILKEKEEGKDKK